MKARAVVDSQKVFAARRRGGARDRRRLGGVAVGPFELRRGLLVPGQGLADAGDEVVLVGEDLRGEALVGEGLLELV